MADFASGWKVLRILAENDWRGMSINDIGVEAEFDYQKTLRILRDLEESGLACRPPDGPWRLSEEFLNILTKAQGSYLDRLNMVQPRGHRPIEIKVEGHIMDGDMIREKLIPQIVEAVNKAQRDFSSTVVGRAVGAEELLHSQSDSPTASQPGENDIVEKCRAILNTEDIACDDVAPAECTSAMLLREMARHILGLPPVQEGQS